jgi:hypothetical protein
MKFEVAEFVGDREALPCEAVGGVEPDHGAGVVAVEHPLHLDPPELGAARGQHERNLGPQVRDASLPGAGLWSYVDIYDLADAIVLAVQSGLLGHEVMYVASPDYAGGHDFERVLRACHASGSSCGRWPV